MFNYNFENGVSSPRRAENYGVLMGGGEKPKNVRKNYIAAPLNLKFWLPKIKSCINQTITLSPGKGKTLP